MANAFLMGIMRCLRSNLDVDWKYGKHQESNMGVT